MFRTLNKNSGWQIIQINDAVQHGLGLKRGKLQSVEGKCKDWPDHADLDLQKGRKK